MKFDDILVEYVGEFGKYQRLQYLLVNLPVILTAMHVLSWSFTSEVLPHRCIYVGEDESNVFNISASWISSLSDSTSSSCRRYKGLNYLEDSVPENATTEPCLDGYRWQSTSYVSTAISRWDLVCEKKWIRSFVQLLYYAGQFFGSYVTGMLSDRFGRRLIFLCAILLQLVCGILMAFVPYWQMFAVLRIGLGFSHPGIFLIAIVIGSELVGPRYRALAGVGAAAFFSFGQIFLGGLAFLFDRYEHLQLCISVPGCLFLAYYWLVPESARWLLMKGRFHDAFKILERAAKFNGRHFPEGAVEAIQLEPNSEESANIQQRKKASILDLFRSPILRRRTLICFYCWAAVSCVYYALSINPSFLGGTMNLSFILGGVLELPALLIILLTVNRFGRRIMLTSGFLFCTLVMFLTLIVPNEMEILKMMMVLLAKSALCGVYTLIYIYSSELFPTLIRNGAMGMCSMIARVGAIAASYFSLWLAEDYAILVTIIYGVIALVAGATTLMLPETAGKPMVETIEDAERLSGGAFKCCRQRTQTKL